MRLSKNRISKILGVNNQSIKKYKNTKESIKPRVSTEASCQNHMILAIAQNWI